MKWRYYVQLAVKTRRAAVRARSAMTTHQAAGVRNRIIINSAPKLLKTSAYLNHQRKLSAEIDVAAHSNNTARTSGHNSRHSDENENLEPTKELLLTASAPGV